MADIKISALLETNGTFKEATKDAKAFNAETSKTKQLMETVSKKRVSSQAAEITEYGRGRAAVGTGAAGRDFAQQAQGLGGLVRLYATYAANVFAVGAAFRALSEAMNTENMIRGLDQLGAASGTSMGTLAKNFADASGGAISLRESMEATAKATTAGLSSKQFMQLGEVAKKASQTLGVSMPDAVSRLTRGISKLEPELLDELGLFTKIGPATEAYARSVNKSVASLTDFERRQAFANAVLTEGIDKFGQIDVPTNPYDKLSASLKNLSQEILSLANTVLGPLISTLSMSPNALAVGIGLLATTIVKQALPAIGEYRKQLSYLSEQAENKATAKLAEAQKARVAQFGPMLVAADAAAQEAHDKAEATLMSADKLVKSKSGRLAKEVREIFKDDRPLTEVTAKELATLDKYAGANTKIAGTYKQLKEQIIAAQKEEQRYNEILLERERILKTKPALGSPADVQSRIAKKAADVSTSRKIVSEASENASSLGILNSFKEMTKSLKESDMGPIRKGFTAIAGTVSMVTTRIIGLVSAFQGYAMVIGLAVAAFQILDSWLTKNAEQAEKFKGALEANDAATKTYTETLKFLQKQSPEKFFATESLVAYANAVTGLKDNIIDLSEKFLELDKATTGWDRFTDNIASFFNKDQLSKYANSATESLQQMMLSIKDLEKAREFEKSVAAALGASGTTRVELFDAIIKKGPQSAKIIQTLGKEFNKFTDDLNIAASRSKEFDESVKTLSNSFKDFVTKDMDKSPLSKLGDDTISFSAKLAGVVQDPSSGLGALLKILSEIKDTGIFNASDIAQVEKMKGKLEELNVVQGQVQQQIISTRKEQQETLNALQQVQNTIRLAENKDPRTGVKRGMASQYDYSLEQKLLAQKQEQERRLEGLITKQNNVNLELATIMKDKTVGNLVVESFNRGSDLTFRAINNAFAKANVDLQRGLLANLQGLQGVAAYEGKLALQDIAIQREDLNLRKEMLAAQNLQIAATYANTAALEAAPMAGRSAKADYSVLDYVEITRKFTEFTQTGSIELAKRIRNDIEAYLKNYKDVLDPKKLAERVTSFAGIQQAIKGVAGAKAGEAALGSKEALEKLNTEIRLAKEKAQIENRTLEFQKSQTQFDLQKLSLIEQQNGYLTEQEILTKQELNNKLINKDYDIAMNNIAMERTQYGLTIAEVAKIRGQKAAEEFKASSDALLTAKKTSAEKKKQSDIENNIVATKLAIIKLEKAERDRLISNNQLVSETAQVYETMAIDRMEKELEYLTRTGQLSQDQIDSRKKVIEQLKIESEYTAKILSLQTEYAKYMSSYAAERATKVEGSDAQKQLDEEQRLRAGKFAADTQQALAARNARLSDLRYYDEATKRQEAYANIFNSTIDSMSDALIEFAKTGKFSFSSLINTMIAELVRFEMRAMMMKAFGGGGSILGNLVNMAIGAFTGPSATDIAAFADIGPAPPPTKAKGAAYDFGGIERFAKGGAFTNSIVNNPTLFKFAKGTGLMGEAGPEAIMPLKRDSNGNLGVRSSQQKTEVVVNNYSGQPAQARETEDARGNRRIEVVVGDMTAGELTRNGSNTNKAIRGTFGLQPQLIRR